jgi:hypothetical protein
VECEEDFDPGNSSLLLNTVFNRINNEYEHELLDEEIRLLNAHLIRQSTDHRVSGQKY